MLHIFTLVLEPWIFFLAFFALMSRKIFTRFSFQGKPTVIGPKDGKGAKEEKHEANAHFKHENKLSEEIQYLYQGGETDLIPMFFACF